MTNGAKIMKGTVRGKVIELEEDSGLPDGQAVSVTVTSEDAPALAPGEGLRMSFGSWAEGSEGLDEFLEQLRHPPGSGRASS